MPPWNRPKSADTTIERRQAVEEQVQQRARCPAAPSRAAACASRRCDPRSSPDSSRLTMPKPSISDSMLAPRGRRRSRGRRSRRRCAPAASTSPRSTASPAITSSVCSARGEMPRSAGWLQCRAAACVWLDRGGRRRSTSVSGSIVSRHDDSDDEVRVAPADGLDQVLHDRRPDRAGQVVAAGHDRDTARPRRRSNQCEMSASSGPNVAELPRKPISRPCASAYVQQRRRQRRNARSRVPARALRRPAAD